MVWNRLGSNGSAWERSVSKSMKSTTDDRFPLWKSTLDMHRTEVLRLPGVVSVGIGGRAGDEHVVVLVTRRDRKRDDRIRRSLPGLEVEIKKSAPFGFLARAWH